MTQHPKTLADDLREAVLVLAADSPYTVQRTDDGFDVTLDLAEARFYSLFTRHGLNKVFIQRISVDEEAQTFTMLDASRAVEWSAGVSASDPVPRFSGSIEIFQGRSISVQKQRIYAWDQDLQFRKVVDYDFSTSEGHALVRAAAAQVGLTERWPWQAKVGLVVGVGTLALLAIAGIGVLIAWLAGAF